jgi:hypothetical protein
MPLRTASGALRRHLNNNTPVNTEVLWVHCGLLARLSLAIVLFTETMASSSSGTYCSPISHFHGAGRANSTQRTAMSHKPKPDRCFGHDAFLVTGWCHANGHPCAKHAACNSNCAPNDGGNSFWLEHLATPMERTVQANYDATRKRRIRMRPAIPSRTITESTTAIPCGQPAAAEGEAVGGALRSPV